MDRHHNQDMQEQGKGKAPVGNSSIHLDGFTVPQQGDTAGFNAKIRTIRGIKECLTFWTKGIIIITTNQAKERT
jgi:hypothetical protein